MLSNMFLIRVQEEKMTMNGTKEGNWRASILRLMVIIGMVCSHNIHSDYLRSRKRRVRSTNGEW